MTSFDKLIKFYKTHNAIAAAFNVTRQTVTYWKQDGIPFSRALEIEKKTKGEISALEILRN